MKQVGDGGAKMVQRETKGECYYGCLLCVCVLYCCRCYVSLHMHTPGRQACMMCACVRTSLRHNLPH